MTDIKALDLRPGDIFLTRNPMWLGKIIRAVEKFYSTDNRAIYSHAGIITSKEGMTFESLTRIKYGKLAAYAGEKVAVYRFDKMSNAKFTEGMESISNQNGDIYPFYKLAIMAIKPLAKYVNFGPEVCSELVAEFLKGAGVDIFWKGMNPDDLFDFMKTSREFTLIFEGIL